MGSNPTPSARTLYYSKRGDGRFRFTRWDLNPQGRGGVGEVLDLPPGNWPGPIWESSG